MVALLNIHTNEKNARVQRWLVRLKLVTFCELRKSLAKCGTDSSAQTEERCFLAHFDERHRR